ncbi:DUF2778 domain-containing protein [Methylobacterium dankookense]|uniref:Tlde1 domain-containing protein n=1 Tax=Methylobacterium dankookense TaxID=560405 RepID=A0A564G370_9HYPH|nr:DUF2778 domain-containing protein [Methylobacterium dankookense]GJD54697.1 hypothetical protein IFDJLNFL_0575 [Methylobacterium dankookense]VUF14410.1 hypothetical protein MTDSW087_04132 [Methylobacterium dankookense]
MFDAAYPPSRPIRARRRSRGGRLALLVPVLALGAVGLPRLLSSVDAPPAPAAERFVVVSDRAAPTPAPIPAAPRRRGLNALFEPVAVLGAATPTLAGSAPLAGDLVPAAPPPALLAAAPTKPAPESAPSSASPALAAAPQPKPAARLAEAAPLATPVPLPVARPAELRPRPLRLAERVAERPSTRRARIAARQEAEAEQSFFDAVFGAKPAAPEATPAPEARPTALAYAGTGRDAGLPPRGGGGLFEPRAEGGTAIYDITARTVTLPSGEVLEAHSGLGKSQDNPRDVHIRMRGATPPGTYVVTEREALFHGVRALRLTPVGGSASIHGRDGILAHTYMLGPSGASNGCVVFRNYDRFLQAYLRGEIRRLVVVAGSGDALSSGVARLFGR